MPDRGAPRPDYYAVLGVERGADAYALKKAYRARAASFHPDRHQGDSDATEAFMAVVEAYSVLSHPERRKAYDAGHTDRIVIVETGSSLEELLGKAVDHLFGVRAKRPVDGRDCRYDLTVSFAEAARGAERELWLPREVACPTCEGRRYRPGSVPEICPRCRGLGELQVRRTLRSIIEDCPDCDGLGYLVTRTCEDCGGSGTREERRELRIRVPAGVEAGARLLVRGAGQPGRHGGSDGDCFVHIEVRAHPRLERVGRDVHCERPVRVFDAVLGAELRVPTVDGLRRVRMPAGSPDGTTLRMVGYGIGPDGERGDQLVRIRIELPEGLAPEERSALAEAVAVVDPSRFAATHRFEEEMSEPSGDE